MTAHKITRDVTPKECPWLKQTLRKGTIVYDYTGVTYGCIGLGKAVSLEEDKEPFFELPWDAIFGLPPRDALS